MSNVRSVKLVPEILVSEGIVIVSSISFFIFLFFTYQKSKNLLGRDEKFCYRYFPNFSKDKNNQYSWWGRANNNFKKNKEYWKHMYN